MGFQHPADRGRGNPQLLSDLCHGQTFLVEAGQRVAVYDQPRPPIRPCFSSPAIVRSLIRMRSCLAIMAKMLSRRL